MLSSLCICSNEQTTGITQIEWYNPREAVFDLPNLQGKEIEKNNRYKSNRLGLVNRTKNWYNLLLPF